MIDKRIYSQKVEEFKKVIKPPKFKAAKFWKTKNGLFFIWNLIIFISLLILTLSTYYKTKIFTFLLAIHTLFFSFYFFSLILWKSILQPCINSVIEIINKTKRNSLKIKKNYKKTDEDLWIDILNMLGFKKISSSGFSFPTDMIGVNIKSFEAGYSFENIQFINTAEYLCFNIKKSLFISTPIFVGDFSKNKDLYCLKKYEKWHIYSPKKDVDTEFLTSEFRSKIEDFIVIFKGKKFDFNKDVLIQITPEGIKGAVKWGYFYFDLSASAFKQSIIDIKDWDFVRGWDLIKNGDVFYDKDYPSLYECACILEKFNKYIEENKF